ncbi:MAG: c-type cytochrome [Flavobacteriales bacterium]|nr:c-type cytochrome [Flavobacteriales bacterium]
MKISNIQMLNGLRKLAATILLMSLSLLNFKAFSQGEALFKSKCATCHQTHKNGTGPKLFQVRDKWASGGAKEGSIYQWVNNWQTAAASDPYAAEVSKWSPTAMSAFPDLKKEDIDAILDWVDAQPDPATAAPAGGGATEGGAAGQMTDGTEEEGSIAWIWIVMGVIFIVVIMAVGGVRRQLNIATSEDPASQEKLTYGEELRSWAWKNKVYVGVATLIVVISLIVGFFQSLYSIGVVEGYQPSQPIAFPHDRHAGINGIDCKYCHNSVTKSKHAGIPSVNVCMNCHKQINGEGKPFAGEIQKIYKAAGWDPSGAGKYTGKETPIVWNKVHVLPDHVYFNHSQHVSVGGIDCKQCHGDMTTMNETAKVQPVEELNKIEGNIKLTRPTLTMGWCIECHGAKEVALGNGKSGYYDEIHRRLKKDKALYRKYLKDGKITVNELGGWECAKCHY